MIKAVFLDLYGTLITPEKHPPLPGFFKSKKVDLAEARFLLKTEYGSLSEFFDKLYITTTREEYDTLQQQLEKSIQEIQLYPETKEVLEELKKREIDTIVVSNLAQMYRDPFFRFGLDKLVTDHVFSFEVGYVKPQKEIYEKAMMLVPCEPNEVLFVGDKIPQDVLGPREFGMKSVHLARDGESEEPEYITDLRGIFWHLD